MGENAVIGRYNRSSAMIIIEQRRRRRSERRRLNIAAFVCVVAVIVALSAVIVKGADSSAAPQATAKYYTSIDIEKNDTLWNIAASRAPKGTDISQYVNELKRINNLAGDNITAGNSLIVYYYGERQ